MKSKTQAILHNFTIRHLAIVFSTIFMLILMLISIFSFLWYEKALIAKSADLVERLDIQVAEKVDNFVADTIELTKTPLYFEDIMKGLFDNVTFNTKYMNDAIEAMLFSNFFNKKYIYSVILMNKDGSSYARTKTNIYNFNSNLITKELYEDANERGKTVILPTHKIDQLENVVVGNPLVFSVFRSLYYVPEGTFCGSVLVSVDLDFLREICKKIQISPEHRIIFSDKNGNVIYDTDEKNIGSSLDSQLIHIKTGQQVLQGKECLVSEYSLDNASWKLTSIVPVSLINKEAKRIGNVTMSLNYAVFLMLLFFNGLLFIRLTKPLQDLVYNINQIKGGNTDVALKVQGKDEIAQLSEGYNEMLSRMKNLIGQIYKVELRHKNAELKALQRQINPHFINNTLESIYMMAILNNDNDVADMTSALGRVVKYSISDSRQKVSVRREIEHLNDYLYIQKIRFEDKLTAVVDMDEEVLDKEIIKLLLQPIVENAIYHGIEAQMKVGKIIIRGYMSDSRIIFVVRDDGAGIGEGDLEELVCKINDFDSEFDHIGLKNVNERIKLFYGDEYGVQIYSRKNEGTVVKVILPSILYNEEEQP